MTERSSSEMTKAELLAKVRAGRAELEAALSAVPETKLNATGIPSEWSGKDIVGHIAAWEWHLVALLKAVRGQGEMPPSYSSSEDVDQFNSRVFAENRGKSLDELREDFRRAHSAALGEVESFPEADLLDPQRFGWTEGRALWRWVVMDTCGHYQEHLDGLRLLAE